MAVLLVGLLWPATRAMPIAWIIALGVGFFAWNMPPDWLAAASITGVMTALEILWIVFGALLLLYTLMQAGAFDRINQGFATISDDRRVQIVLLGFFLATFIEGAAGFGTPAAVVAPLLLGLGFPALAAVIAAIIGHVIAVTYGAVGTPIIVGIQDPLASAGFQDEIAQGGYTVPEYSTEVAAWAATYHTLVGFVMPLFAVGMVVYFFGDRNERSLSPAWEVAPLCLASGIAFAVPYWLSAWFFTAEFPSLIGSMVGGAIIVSVLKAGYLLPDSHWDFPPRSEWPSHWVGTIEPGENGATTGRPNKATATDGGIPSGPEMSLARAWSPYVLVVVLLVVTRAVGPISSFINRPAFIVEWQEILGTGISGSIAWMNVPGFWLIVSAVLAIPIFGMSGGQVSAAWREAGQKIVSPLIALIFVIAMVQVMINSGAHPGAPAGGSMIVVLATATADLLGPVYPAVAALIGALGAAMAGSNTVSNITFGGFQFEAAQQLGLPTQIIVGAQAVGGAIGNLVAIHNVVAALATVGLVGQEGRVMRLNLIPLVYYSIFVGFWALLFSYVLFPSAF
ncbi:L-lactate permease [Halalkalicoccus jeotgali B3]|uniref:L-lactate permease n=1 Tax=Halalkalicoccus jeotgali (strain DSM 18796 / CECT 7217 / JCM 14584 / KCTC 4019 / B3) TaxID=795797 RepID=D8J3M2_HALJB|nr:L-lactate permease [Halalkalicoccus jeotgali B3]ELY35458.1 L-lactate permease [Halalkalicoccus jeotgali B3]